MEICAVCEQLGLEVEMKREEFVDDFNDPREEYGHGQRVIPAFVCPKCGNIKVEKFEDAKFEDVERE